VTGRDNSNDSRVWGTVPAALIKSRATTIWFSTGPHGLRWTGLANPTSDHPPPGTRPAVRHRAAAPGEAPLTAAAYACRIQTDYPHQSTSPGRDDVLAKGRVRCTSPVDTIAITVRLYYYGVVKDEASFADLGTDRLEGLASSGTECADGNYRGQTEWFIRYPPGTIPQEDRGTDEGTEKFVKCREYVCDRSRPGVLACPIR
jgi:hypothetical protein